MQRIVELAIVMVACLTPQFILASEIDGDEFAKATSGIALAGVIVAAYKVYLSSSQKKAAEKKALEKKRLEGGFSHEHDLGIGGIEDEPDEPDETATVDLLEPLRKPPEFYHDEDAP